MAANFVRILSLNLASSALLFYATSAKAFTCSDLFRLTAPARIAYFPELPREGDDIAKKDYENFVRKNYEYSESEPISWLKTKQGQLPAIVKGKVNESELKPKIDIKKAKWDPENKNIDVVVTGSGLAGLNLADYLAGVSKDAGKKLNILILEANEKIGGIANWSTRAGITYGEGGAYFTPPEGYWKEIAIRIGLWDSLEKYKIPDYIDSYFHNKKFYGGIWESKEAMQALPADFAAFLYMINKLSESGDIYIQPIDMGKNIKYFDNITMRDWMLTIPENLKKLAESGDEVAKDLYTRLTDAKTERFSPDNLWEKVKDSLERRIKIKNVNGLLELYGRSAAGDHPNVINAALFLNFYISEVGVRFTGEEGSGVVTRHLIEHLNNYKDQIKIITSATVAKIVPQRDGTTMIYYIKDGQTYKVKSKKTGFSAPLKFAPDLIEGFDKTAAPEKIAAIEKLSYRHYLVINLHLQNHSLALTYDLWARLDKAYSQRKITDIIDGRWMHFRGLPGEQRNDNRGLATIYVPLPAELSFEHISNKQILKLSQNAIDQALTFINESNGAQGVKAVAAQINVWPNSIHVATVGHFTRMTAFNTPFNGVYFAHSNQGTPSVEEALIRGYFAANKILYDLGIVSELIKIEQPQPVPMSH